jgi:hypothetical protein
MMGCCEHGNEHSVKCGEVLDCLRNYQHFKKDCDVWQRCGAVAAWQREVASVADRQVRSLRETQLDHSQGTINKRQARPAICTVFLLPEPVSSRAPPASQPKQKIIIFLRFSYSGTVNWTLALRSTNTLGVRLEPELAMSDRTQLLRDLEIQRAQNCYKSIPVLCNDVTRSADSRAGLRTDQQTGYELQNEKDNRV